MRPPFAHHYVQQQAQPERSYTGIPSAENMCLKRILQHMPWFLMHVMWSHYRHLLKPYMIRVVQLQVMASGGPARTMSLGGPNLLNLPE